MVSSELVVLLIVCVGINTGSAQGELATIITQKNTTLMLTVYSVFSYRILSNFTWKN